MRCCVLQHTHSESQVTGTSSGCSRAAGVLWDIILAQSLAKLANIPHCCLLPVYHCCSCAVMDKDSAIVSHLPAVPSRRWERCCLQMACLHTTPPSTPTAVSERVHRGVADPVYLYFPSFVQLAIHRTCTHIHAAVSNDADRYDVRVQRETERRGVSIEVAGTFCPYQLHHFSLAQLDAAHRSVVNARSRARTTNEAEFSRLRQRALDKQNRVVTRPKRPRPTEAGTVSGKNPPPPPVELQPSSKEWPAFLRSLEEMAPVPPLDPVQATTLTEVRTLPAPSCPDG